LLKQVKGQGQGHTEVKVTRLESECIWMPYVTALCRHSLDGAAISCWPYAEELCVRGARCGSCECFAFCPVKLVLGEWCGCCSAERSQTGEHDACCGGALTVLSWFLVLLSLPWSLCLCLKVSHHLPEYLYYLLYLCYILPAYCALAYSTTAQYLFRPGYESGLGLEA